MSLARAIDPTAGPSRLVCEVPTCRCAEAPRPVRVRRPGWTAPESRWLCRRHHAEAHAEGLTQDPPPPARPTLVPAPAEEEPSMPRSTWTCCRVPGCNINSGLRHGVCSKHTQRFAKLGHKMAEFGTWTDAQIAEAAAAWDARKKRTAAPQAPAQPAAAGVELSPRWQDLVRKDSPAPAELAVLVESTKALKDINALCDERGVPDLVGDQTVADRVRNLVDRLIAEHHADTVGACDRARAQGQEDAVRALLLALDRQPWELKGLSSELNLALCVAIATATSDEQGSKLLAEARAERDEARAAIDAANTALRPLADRYKTESLGAIVGAVLFDLERLPVEPPVLSPTPDDGPLLAVEWELDLVQAPRAESLVERIRQLRTAHLAELVEATEHATRREAELVDQLRTAKDGQARLSQQLEEAEMQARTSHEAAQMWRLAVCSTLGVDPEATGLGEIPGLIEQHTSAATVVALASWLHESGVHDEVIAAGIHAVADQLVPAAALVEAMHDRVALARLMLSTRLPAPNA